MFKQNFCRFLHFFSHVRTTTTTNYSEFHCKLNSKATTTKIFIFSFLSIQQKKLAAILFRNLSRVHTKWKTVRRTNTGSLPNIISICSVRFMQLDFSVEFFFIVLPGRIFALVEHHHHRCHRDCDLSLRHHHY